jgi:hypothetical protein
LTLAIAQALAAELRDGAYDLTDRRPKTCVCDGSEEPI